MKIFKIIRNPIIFYRKCRLNAIKTGSKYKIDLKNLKFQQEINEVNNDKDLMSAKVEHKKTQIENEKVSSKLRLLETARKLNIKIYLYPLMFFSSIITPMGFGLLDHINVNNFLSSITSDTPRSILLMFFIMLSIVGFNLSSRCNIVDLIFNKNAWLSKLGLGIFIPVSIIGNITCFIGFLGGGFMNTLFSITCGILLEVFIHLLSALKFDSENKNYSFKEDYQTAYNTNILNMITTIISSKISDVLFNSYIESQEKIVLRYNKLKEINNKAESKNNIVEPKNDIVESKNNIVEPKNNKAESKNNIVESKNNKAESKNNIVEPKNNKAESKNNKAESKNNIVEPKNNIVEHKISPEDLEILVTSYVEKLKIGERFNDKDLSYLGVGVQRIRRIKDKLKNKNILESQGTTGTFKVANVK